MNVYKVLSNRTDYDEYFSIVVVAESEKRALEIAIEGNPWDWKTDPSYAERSEKNHAVYWEFTEHQFPLEVIKIDLDREQVIDSSNRGS